jgi:hypothetical protein
MFSKKETQNNAWFREIGQFFSFYGDTLKSVTQDLFCTEAAKAVDSSLQGILQRTRFFKFLLTISFRFSAYTQY